jgi:hypothetical protein
MNEGIKRRDAGLERVSRGFGWWVAEARERAIKFARRHGDVCSDDVHNIYPLPEGAHPSLMGMVFRDNRFKRVAYTPSKRPTAHARIIRLYKVREQ